MLSRFFKIGLGTIATLLVSILVIALLHRTSGQSAVGIYGVMTSSVVFGSLYSSGSQQFITRYFSLSDSKVLAKHICFFLFINLLFTLISSIFVIVLIRFIISIDTIPFETISHAVIWGSLGCGQISVISAVLKGVGRPVISEIFQKFIPAALVGLLSVIIFVNGNFSIIVFLQIYILTYFSIFLLVMSGAIVTISYSKISLSSSDFLWAKRNIIGTLKFVRVELVNIYNTQSLMIISFVFGGAQLAGSYKLIERIVSLMAISSGIVSVMGQREVALLSEIHISTSSLQDLAQRFSLITISMLIPMGLLLFWVGQPALELLIGNPLSSYEYNLLLGVVCLMIFAGIFGVPGMILSVSGHPDMSFVANMIGVVCSLLALLIIQNQMTYLSLIVLMTCTLVMPKLSAALILYRYLNINCLAKFPTRV